MLELDVDRDVVSMCQIETYPISSGIELLILLRTRGCIDVMLDVFLHLGSLIVEVHRRFSLDLSLLGEG